MTNTEKESDDVLGMDNYEVAMSYTPSCLRWSQIFSKSKSMTNDCRVFFLFVFSFIIESDTKRMLKMML